MTLRLATASVANDAPSMTALIVKLHRARSDKYAAAAQLLIEQHQGNRAALKVALNDAQDRECIAATAIRAMADVLLQDCGETLASLEGLRL